MIGRVNTGGGGAGGTLTVNAPAGVTVTVTKDGKTKTKVADSSGLAVFKGLASGEWTISITDGEQTAQKTVTITADYTAEITFFAATIHVTYPAGSVCTATDGTTTLTAPDTSGTWDCVVPNAGTWTVSLNSGFSETVNVTTSGNTYTVNKWYLYNQGNERTAVTGGWVGVGITSGTSAVAKAPNIDRNSNNMKFYGDASESTVGCGICKNKIDVTGFNKIAFNGTLDAHGPYTFANLRLWSNLSGNINNNVIAKKDVTAGNVVTNAEIDLSSVNGKCVIGFALSGGAAYSWVIMKQLYLMV